MSNPGCYIIAQSFTRSRFMQGSSSKLIEKLPKNVKQPETSQFFLYLSHFEKTSDHKLENYLKKSAADLI